MDTTERKWLNLADSCEYLGLSKSRIYELTSKRKIKFFQPGGKRMFFIKEDLDSWVLSGQKEIIPLVHTR